MLVAELATTKARLLTDLAASKDQIVGNFNEKCTEYSLNNFQPDGSFCYKLHFCALVFWQLLLLLRLLLLRLLELAALSLTCFLCTIQHSSLLLCIGPLRCAAKCGSTMLLGLFPRM